MDKEEQARKAVITWARGHWTTEEDGTPEVAVLSIQYDEDEMNWEAELEVSTSVDNPTVTFIMDDLYGIHPQTVEY